MELTIWNFVLSVLLGLVGWTLKEKSAELVRVTILLNRTREEMAKEYVTKPRSMPISTEYWISLSQ